MPRPATVKKEQVIELAKKGYTAKQIHDRTGISINYVRQIASNHKISLVREKGIKQAKELDPVKEEIREKEARALRGLQMLHKKWADEKKRDGIKECKFCNITKAKSQFYENPNTEDGLYASCISCAKHFQKIKDHKQRQSKRRKELYIPRDKDSRIFI